MIKTGLAICSAAFCFTLSSLSAFERPESGKAASLWSKPTNISSRDLFYGQGGAEHAPTVGPFVFVEEDTDGNSPKFVVKDGRGVLWKVKVGAEARPETVVTRFVWAVGYSTDEDYFVAAQQVENLPRKLKRGGEYVSSDGVVHDARWERMEKGKLGSWKWTDNPFSKGRELNGLRVLMALFNNYDMKDSQNAIYDRESSQQYVISDLGATLGPTGSHWPATTRRGDLKVYSRTDFVKKVTDEYVDFASPSWPMMFGFIPMPPVPYGAITSLLGLGAAPNTTQQRWIGKKVPLADVIWMEGLLEQLSPSQIRSAFRAANYPPDQVEGFSQNIEKRIQALRSLRAASPQ